MADVRDGRSRQGISPPPNTDIQLHFPAMELLALSTRGYFPGKRVTGTAMG